MPALSSKFSLAFPLLSVSYSSPSILLVMRTGTDLSSTGDNDFIFSTPAVPTPSHHKPTASSSAGLTSPVMSPTPMQPMPGSVMSRDDILRAYAERKATSANKDFREGHIGGADQIFRSSGSTLASSGSGGMRTLFNASRVSPTNTYGQWWDIRMGDMVRTGEGRSVRLGMSMMGVMWSIIRMEGPLEQCE